MRQAAFISAALSVFLAVVTSIEVYKILIYPSKIGQGLHVTVAKNYERSLPPASFSYHNVGDLTKPVAFSAGFVEDERTESQRKIGENLR
ncbi:hypothetical protein DL96DRAFT_1808659 [Flagelloscypha sp. PMI_526]|nr:hypothetical protein DL96DRAFT_1808659 [Flagelloscypha sp. PMI_526]